MTESADPQTNLARLAGVSKERPVWLRVGRLFDGESQTVTTDAHLVLDAKELRFVGSRGEAPPADLLAPGRTAPDLELPGFTALPCLIEAHAHLFLDGAPINYEHRKAYLERDGEWMLARARARWEGILRCGIGAVRDAGDKHGVGLALSAESKASVGGLAPRPFLDSPGAAIHHEGRYGSFMGEPLEDHRDEAACVATRVAQGADRIKLLISGIINFNKGQVTAPPQMPVEEVRALVAAAQRHGRQTFAHASGAPGVENAIDGGVTTVEHGFFVTDEQLAKMRDRGVGWVPTFAPVQLQIDEAAAMGWDEPVVANLRRIIDSHQRSLVKAHQMGVKIVAGSDAGSCGVAHGLGFLAELSQMEAAGLPAVAVLHSATGQSAEMLKFPEPIGRLKPGCRSRLILTEHDPTRSVADLAKAKTVWFDGSAASCDGRLSADGL